MGHFSEHLLCSILFSPICLAVSSVISFFFIFVYFSKNNRSIPGTIALALNVTLYTLGDVLISYSMLLNASLQSIELLYISQQMITILFITTVSFYFLSIYTAGDRFYPVFKVFGVVGGILFGVTLLVYQFRPDLFLIISKSKPSHAIHIIPYVLLPGTLYKIRDILLVASMVSALIHFVRRAVYARGEVRYYAYCAGILIVMYTSIGWFIYEYTGSVIFFLQGCPLPRSSISLVLFLSILSLVEIGEIFSKAAKSEESAEKFRQSEENLQHISENVNEVVWITDYPVSQVLYINSIFKEIFNLSVDDLYADIDCWKKRIFPDDKIRVLAAFSEEPLENSFEIEYRIVRGGDLLWLRDRVFPVTSRDGEVYRIIRVLEDITERKNTQDKLSFMAYHDALTGLYNRKAMYEMVADSLLQMTRMTDLKMKAVLFVDLDNFNKINEASGHTVGDRMLRFVSERIMNTVRETDHIFRYGGDEFIVVLNYIDSEYACALVSQKLIDRLSEPYTVNGEKLFIGVSIGIALYPRDGMSIDDLVKNSDIALRDAKRNKNSFIFYNTAMNIRAQEHARIERNLRRTFENDDFLLYYQPIFSDDGSIRSCECLVRWLYEGEYIEPSLFIPIAEESDLIIHISEWIVQEACRSITRLRELGYAIVLAVNISPRHFRTENFVERFQEIIDENGVDPASVKIEITEGVMVDNPGDAILKMKKLNKLGISFSIDDFGTGYSSLSYIKQFPISCLKIDRCFVSDLETNSESKKITNAICAMAHSLGIEVIAEGVETAYQWDYVTSVSCDFVQGFYMSRPVDFDNLVNLLKKMKN